MHLRSYNHNHQVEDVFFLAILFLYSYFFTHSMITQIGRENNLSAEICKCPYKSLVSTFILSNSPLRTTEKTSMGL